jgi:uncharacterized protein YjiS (DUF1127 family)
MPACNAQQMTNHHEMSVLGQLRETVQVWRRRYAERRELSAWTARDLNDVGVSWDDVAHEIDKPFWRA